MGKALLPVLGGVAGTILLPGVGTAIGAGLGAGAQMAMKTPNTPGPAAATPAAPAFDPTLPDFAAQQNAADAAQRRKASTQNLATIMGAPATTDAKTTATATTLG
jgi:hypothetical protein